MKPFPRFILLCLGLALFAAPAHAKRKAKSATPEPLATPAPEPAPLPAEAAPRVVPGEQPSVSLQPFVDLHLGKILTPLGTAAFAQPEVISSLKAAYADGMATCPASHRPAYQLAQGICDAMIAAMNERQNAVVALRGALTSRSSEAQQPRGGGEAVARARDRDAFFTDSQKNAWIQRAAVLRQNVIALCLRERDAERQIGVWSPPAPGPAPGPGGVAASTPSVSVPPAEQDPVMGFWMWQGYQTVNLKADHTIDGSRHGNWYFVSNLSGGRYYECHWQKHNAVDYVVLSADAKKLEGKNKDQKYVYATR